MSKEPVAPSVYVRMGTTSSAYDQQIARQDHDTKARQKLQDQQAAIAASRPGEAMLRTCSLGGKSTHATVILALKHSKDNVVTDYMTCEIMQHGEELVLQMMCPRCVFRHHRKPWDSQFKIHQTNRNWFFTPSKLPKWARGENLWVNPEDPREVLTIPGTVDLPEWAYCPVCNWAFQIEDSVIKTR